MSSSDELILSQFRDAEIVEDLRSVLDVITRSMAIPLYLMFWVADLVYVPERKWEFLALRACIIPLTLGARKYLYTIEDAKRAQFVCATLAGLVALPINLMVLAIPDIGTSYYAGLNLVAIGGLSFLPLTMNFFIYSTFTIYCPYYLIVLSKAHSLDDLLAILVNSFFIVSSIIVCFVIRNYHESLRLRELNLRLALNLEIAERSEKERALMAEYSNRVN